VKTVGMKGSDMASPQGWKRIDNEATEADYLRREGEIFRHILYLCVMSAFLGLGAGS
jgi:hypothetical protein